MDVKGTLQGYVSGDGKSINIPSTIGNSFGSAIGGAIENLFTGSMQLNGVTFALTGDSATAKITGSGNAAPLLSQWDATALFTATNDNVTMNFNASFTSAWPVSNAWPSVLNTYPFTSLTVSSGSAALAVNPGDQSYELDLNATTSLDNTPIGTGLLVVKYASSKLGIGGGFILTGSWSPGSKWPVVGTLTIVGETGVFVSTIDLTDLSAFKSLNLPYLPKKISSGLTFLAAIQLKGGTLAPLEDFFPAGTTLSLLANLPLGGSIAGASVVATLTEPKSTNAFNFQEFSLAWKSTSASSGEIDITINALFNISASETLTLGGEGSFTYGSTPSLNVELTISGTGSWTHPFGIQNLTILSVSISLGLSAEGIAIGLGGTIQIGTGQPNPVNLSVATAILDFEAPSFVYAKLAPSDAGKSVTLANLITDFIPSLNLNNFPLLNDISFTDLEFFAVAAPILYQGKTYQPGVGATGDINFFGYDLDFAFSLITSPQTAVQAKGSISQNGGPIVVSAGGVQLLKLSDVTGTKGPSACIDTTGSGGYCQAPGVSNAYFVMNAAISLLGFLSSSVYVVASSDSFEFDVTLGAGNIFSDKMHCEFIPDKGDFAASVDCSFSPPDITLGPWGPIPQFTIPTPKVAVCFAFGTIVPSQPLCGGFMPTSAPYVSAKLSFSWGSLSFNLSLNLQLSDITNAFSDFGAFLKNLILNNAKAILEIFLQAAEALIKLLYQIGLAIAEIAEKVAAFFGMLLQDAWNLATSVIDALLAVCGVESGNSALSPSFTSASARTHPAFMADLLDTPKGQEVLYHYYLNRDEIEPAMRAQRHSMNESVSGGGSQEFVPSFMALLQNASAQGSPTLQASAAELLPKLEQYRNLSYSEFLTALNA
ncbi:MAG TPA: hypothetical protein VM733_09405 [Thermoanaerobaculia bacterium]|nr:hypothetical protein [Thermoanaerobaculia bacterium]